jgi:pimeloyl-ACP methyl ester carboxylesterase
VGDWRPLPGTEYTGLVSTPDPWNADVAIRSAAGDLYARRWGDPASQSVVFLLHGTPGCRLSIWPKAEVLREFGICVITYDRPGYGRSAPRTDRRVIDAAHEVATIADHFGYDTFSVVGRSGGGPHALACASVLPDRVTRVVSLAGLAPVDARGLRWDQGMIRPNRRAYAAARRSRRDLLRHLGPLAARLSHHPEQLLTRTLAGAHDMDLAVMRDERYEAAMLASFREAFSSPQGWVSDVLALARPWGFLPSEIKAPTWLWHGGFDVFTPASHSRWLALRIPDVRLSVDRRAGHFGALKKQALAIRWAANQAADQELQPSTSRAAPNRSGAGDGPT